MCIRDRSIDVETIYDVPIKMMEEGLDKVVLNKLKLISKPPKLDHWKSFLYKYKNPKRNLSIGLVGKYVELQDSEQELYNQELRNLDEVNPSSIYSETDEEVSYTESKPKPRPDNSQAKISSQNIKNRIRQEFETVLRLLDFDTKAHDIFRRWYVDGRLFYHKVIDPKNPQKGLQQVRYVDPRKIKKVREVQKGRKGNVEVVKEAKSYYLYNPAGSQLNNTSTGMKLTEDSVSYCPSGLIDMHKGTVLSYLNKAIKPVNQLRMIEDAVVIYRISRAPERRIFYIDVGNLPKVKAEQYLRDVMSRYRNKLVYDANTGEIKDDKKFMSMLEDFWLPRREGGRGTEISTLPGGQNLGELKDVEYFRKKLYNSLNLPPSRLTDDNKGFNLGITTEVLRDVLKFT